MENRTEITDDILNTVVKIEDVAIVQYKDNKLFFAIRENDNNDYDRDLENMQNELEAKSRDNNDYEILLGPDDDNSDANWKIIKTKALTSKRISDVKNIISCKQVINHSNKDKFAHIKSKTKEGYITIKELIKLYHHLIKQNKHKTDEILNK